LDAKQVEVEVYEKCITNQRGATDATRMLIQAFMKKEVKL
jgi:hypothetical protein